MEDVHFPPLARFRFQLRARTPIELPDYTGSTWRGLIGTALRAAVCVPRLAHCEPCLIQPYCAFFHWTADYDGEQWTIAPTDVCAAEEAALNY